MIKLSKVQECLHDDTFQYVGLLDTLDIEVLMKRFGAVWTFMQVHLTRLQSRPESHLESSSSRVLANAEKHCQLNASGYHFLRNKSLFFLTGWKRKWPFFCGSTFKIFSQGNLSQCGCGDGQFWAWRRCDMELAQQENWCRNCRSK